MCGSGQGHEENNPTDFRQPNNLHAPSPIAFPPGKAPIASSSWRVFDLPPGVSILRSQSVFILTSLRGASRSDRIGSAKDRNEVAKDLSPGRTSVASCQACSGHALLRLASRTPLPLPALPAVAALLSRRPLHFPRPAFTLQPFTLWQPLLFPKKGLGKSISATTRSLVILGI